MQIHVYFTLDGIKGRETFATEVYGIISKYLDVESQFWKKAHEAGAVTRTSGGNAWCQVDTLDGPIVLFYERVEIPENDTYYKSGKIRFE